MKKLSNITESVWSNIQSRSTGDSVRKEDDIDNLNAEDFINYLDNNYELKTPNDLKMNLRKNIGDLYDSIDFPISLDPIKEFGGYKYDNFMIYYNPNENTITDIRICFINSSSSCKKKMIEKLKENFRLLNIFFGSGDRKEFKILPIDGGDATNSFALKVIDFVSDNIEEPAKKTIFKK